MPPARNTVVSETSHTPIAGPSPKLMARIRSEYLEMPGLRLTLLQARRLWCVDALTCSAALTALESSGFLARTRDGSYVLAGSERLRA